MQDLKEATRELEMLTSIMSEQSTQAPGTASTPSGTTSEAMHVDKPDEATASTQDESKDHPEAPPAKWQKGEAKGQNKAGRGKGRKQDSERSDNHNWSNSSWKKWDDKPDKEHKELKSLVVMMGSLLLRHEDQQNITRLDGGFVLFLRTDVENNLAKGLYHTAQQWKTTKQQYPEKLTLPMRVVLFQSVVMTTAARWEKVISDPELLKKAIEAKWISPDGQTTLCLQWDNVKKAHVPALGGNQIPIKEVNTLLMELVTRAKLPLVVNRFHATRPLSEEYSSPVLPMLIEVGGRTDAARKAWQILDRLAYTSVWISSTTYLRHERLQRSQLANRVSDYLRQMSSFPCVAFIHLEGDSCRMVEAPFATRCG